MAEANTKTQNPTIRLGRLKTPSAVRCAFVRLANAVLSGKVDVKRANSAMYAVAGARTALELEVAADAVEQARALRALRERQLPQPAMPALEHDDGAGDALLQAQVVAGEVVP